MSSQYPANAQEMLAAMARMYNYDLSSFESMLWTGEVFDIYQDAEIVLALKYYMENGNSSHFMPKYGDIKKILEVQDDTVQQINLLVSRYGSYSPPPENETTPLILATIEQLGGWTKVCAEMPDSEDGFQFSQYIKRAESACHAAKKRLNVYLKPPKPLIGRGDFSSFRNEENQRFELPYQTKNQLLTSTQVDKQGDVLPKKPIAFSKAVDKMTSTLRIRQLTSELNP